MTSKQIRVDMIILEYHPIVGGAQRQLALVAPLLRERGVAVRVLTRRYPGLPAYEEIEGIPVHRLPAPGPKPLAALTFMLSALAEIRRNPPDLLHAYSLLSPLTTAVAAKRLWGVPVVVKVLRGGSLGDLERVQNKPFSRRRLASYRQNVDAFVTISREIENELLGIGIPPKRCIFIPNGVDVERFKPLSPERKMDMRRALGLPDGPLAVYTGRLAPEKQVDRLVGMWPTVRNCFPEASLLLLGTGEEEAVLREMAGDGVYFGGVVADVVPYLQSADLFVLPSATEGLSNSLLEAMAVGLPCVATAVGGAPDVIENGRSGWLVPPDDAAALETAVLSVISSLDRRQGPMYQARETISQNFALTFVASRLRLLYDSVMAENK